MGEKKWGREKTMQIRAHTTQHGRCEEERRRGGVEDEEMTPRHASGLRTLSYTLPHSP